MIKDIKILTPPEGDPIVFVLRQLHDGRWRTESFDTKPEAGDEQTTFSVRFPNSGGNDSDDFDTYEDARKSYDAEMARIFWEER